MMEKPFIKPLTEKEVELQKVEQGQNRKLRRAAERAACLNDGAAKVLAKENARLKAENERLREALKEILKDFWVLEKETGTDHDSKWQAKEALEETK